MTDEDANGGGGGGGATQGPPPSKKTAAAAAEPLRPENVRWFYKSDSSRRWTKFDGSDSLNIEHRYRTDFGGGASRLNGEHDRLVVVRGGLYEVDLLKKKCTSIFWPGERARAAPGVRITVLVIINIIYLY